MIEDVTPTSTPNPPNVLTDLPPQEYLARVRDALAYVANVVGTNTDLPLLVRAVLVERIAASDEQIASVIDLLESPDELLRINSSLRGLLVREA